MWRNHANTSGFSLTFSPYPASEFSGSDWTDSTMIFGIDGSTISHWSIEETVMFDEEISTLKICGPESGDFEGF